MDDVLVVSRVSDLAAILRDIIAEERREWLATVPKPEGEQLTVEHVGRVLNTSTTTVRRYIASGRLAAVRTGFGGRGKLLVSRASLDAFLARCSTARR